MQTPYHTLNFSYNWNNKLHNNAFTSLRLHNDSKYIVGDTYEIVQKDEQLGKATLIEKRVLLLDKITPFISFLDTGYDVAEMIKIIKTMYKNKNIDWENQYMDFCLFVYKKTT
jgi:hypothetical protein